MKNLLILVLSIALISIGANAVFKPSPVPVVTAIQLPTPAATPALTPSQVPTADSAVANSNVVTAPVASDDRPCDFTKGISMPVPGSANETVEEIQKKHEADSKTPRPRLKCLKELSPEKLKTLLTNSHMGMQNGRAGIFSK